MIVVGMHTYMHTYKDTILGKHKECHSVMSLCKLHCESALIAFYGVCSAICLFFDLQLMPVGKIFQEVVLNREITAAYVMLPHSYLHCSGHHCHNPGQWSEGGVCVW